MQYFEMKKNSYCLLSYMLLASSFDKQLIIHLQQLHVDPMSVVVRLFSKTSTAHVRATWID